MTGFEELGTMIKGVITDAACGQPSPGNSRCFEKDCRQVRRQQTRRCQTRDTGTDNGDRLSFIQGRPAHIRHSTHSPAHATSVQGYGALRPGGQPITGQRGRDQVRDEGD
ncbi:hypothetical protein GCM10011317_10500 [Niveispirillum cyanobacteriorum]|nr:hypothetical protein GCM10011317_10500 [Niveispirillum cyanobacteriorum]